MNTEFQLAAIHIARGESLNSFADGMHVTATPGVLCIFQVSAAGPPSAGYVIADPRHVDYIDSHNSVPRFFDVPSVQARAAGDCRGGLGRSRECFTCG